MNHSGKKILITYRIPEESVEALRKAGFELVWPEGERMSREEICKWATECVAAISVFGTPFPDEALKKDGTLKMVSNYGAGVDNIHLEVATKNGIVVTNTPDEVTEPTAELAIALMLTLARRVAELNMKLRDRLPLRWGVMENLGTLLYGKTLGILGMGRIGKATAQRALALGMKMIYHNRTPLPQSAEQKYQASWVSFDELLAKSDVLSIHTPLTEETRHMIDSRALTGMKPTALLVNTARGAVIDEKALATALARGKPAGAALDVFEKEPDIPEAFRKLDNVVIVPHIGTATLETRIEIGKRAASNILEFMEGKRPLNCVNPEVF